MLLLVLIRCFFERPASPILHLSVEFAYLRNNQNQHVTDQLRLGNVSPTASNLPPSQEDEEANCDPSSAGLAEPR